MLLFLGPRTGLVVASLVPMAMIASLLVMSFLDIGLDQMSLAALIIALGMLVDNAIVMAESIMVQMAAGRRPVDAAVDSARELRVPLLISSLTTAAAFLPISLAQSTTGEYTAPLFKVITIALLSSWLLALTMTSLLCVLFLRVRPIAAGERFAGRFHRAYRGLLVDCLRRPALTLAAIIGVFLLAMQGFRIIPNIFFPPSDRAIFTAAYELPAGTSMKRTLEVVEPRSPARRRPSPRPTAVPAGAQGRHLVSLMVGVLRGGPSTRSTDRRGQGASFPVDGVEPARSAGSNGLVGARR